jgi:hypothetical protein
MRQPTQEVVETFHFLQRRAHVVEGRDDLRLLLADERDLVTPEPAAEGRRFGNSARVD